MLTKVKSRWSSDVPLSSRSGTSLTPASDVPSRLRLRFANRHQLIVPRCRLNTYGRRVFSIAGLEFVAARAERSGVWF